ncbi:MAG: hypothetical protein IPM81_15770 [Saprospirales bacterium]|nr:hypothetical protein [Saprospirales bacterium]
METNPSNEARIAALEQDLLSAKTDAQKYMRDLEKLRQQYAEDVFAERQQVKQLREERHRVQLDYEQLRVQKGGFGLKALLLSSFAGFFGGLVLLLAYLLLLKPKAEHTLAFEQFRNAHLFNYERAISAGKFGEVEQDLQYNLGLPENRLIQPEIEFAKKLVGAARRRCE